MTLEPNLYEIWCYSDGWWLMRNGHKVKGPYSYLRAIDEQARAEREAREAA
jgi:hypothetical protein